MLLWLFGFSIFLILLVVLTFRSLTSGDKANRERQFRSDVTSVVNIWERIGEDRKCAALRRELLNRVHHRREIAERLLASTRKNHPGRSQRWYLEKVIYDLKRGR